MFNEEVQEIARKKLGLGDNWEIVYTSLYAPVLIDPSDIPSDVVDQCIDQEELTELIESYVDSIELPKGFRLIGMAEKEKKYCPTTRKYGLVDLSGIGAV